MCRVIGASVTGRSHEAAGKDCEDASGQRAEPELTCLAVADGAGSRLDDQSGDDKTQVAAVRATFP